MAANEPDDLERRIAALESKVAALEEQLDAPLPQSSINLPRHLTASPSPAQPPPPPPPSGARPSQGPVAQKAPPSAPPPRSHEQRWTEQITTEVALKWAGLGLLFLAATFLVSTAVSRGWIGPELQLAGAAAIGFALIALGVRSVTKLPQWAQPFGLAGVAVLFTSAGAASEWLDLGGVGTGTIAASAVALAGLWLAQKYSWILVGLLTLFGSLSVLGWVGAPDEYSVGASILYTFALAVLLHALAVDRRWPLLYVATAVTMMVVQLAGSFEEESVIAVQILIVATGLAHWLVPMIFEHRAASTRELTRLAGRVTLAIPAWMWMCTVVLHDLGTNAAIAVAAAVSLAAIASALLVQRHVGTWLWAAQILSAAVAVSVGLAYWLDGSTLLGALAAQAAVMLVLATRIDDGWFWWQSIATAGVVSVAAFGLTMDAIAVDAPWGADLVHLFVFAVALGIGLANRDTDVGRIIGVGAYIALLVWVASVCVHFGQGQLIISAVWATIGLAVVVVGLTRQNMLVARVGLLTLAVVVVKLLTVDLAEIDTFWRAGLFFVIGVGFLWLSYSVPGLLGRDADSNGTDKSA